MILQTAFSPEFRRPIHKTSARGPTKEPPTSPSSLIFFFTPFENIIHRTTFRGRKRRTWFSVIRTWKYLAKLHSANNQRRPSFVQWEEVRGGERICNKTRTRRSMLLFSTLLLSLSAPLLLCFRVIAYSGWRFFFLKFSAKLCQSNWRRLWFFQSWWRRVPTAGWMNESLGQNGNNRKKISG